MEDTSWYDDWIVPSGNLDRKSRSAYRVSNTDCMARVLVTGFEPFAQSSFNPSEAILREFPLWVGPKQTRLHIHRLRTDFEVSGRQIVSLVKRICPEKILLLGLAEDRDGICLERLALNLDDSSIPDNRGVIRHGRPILRKGPAAYFSTVPVDSLCKRLSKKGVPVAISNHAGTFVCNHVYFKALHCINALSLSCQCLLVHLPGTGRPGKKVPLGTTSWPDVCQWVRHVFIEYLRLK